MLSRRLPVPVVAAVALALALPAAAQAQQSDVIRGRIVGPDSAPVANAQVTATSAVGGVSRSVRTDRGGRFTIAFPNGEGDYWISIAALGFAARRFEVKRVADEEVLLADARLQRVGAVLDAVIANAPRDRVRRDAATADVGGGEQELDRQQQLPADQWGDLAAMAASLPGVQLVPGQDGDPNGYSVLGLGADQNNATLNGLNFGGAGLPRDAAVSSSLNSSPYDVSRGGFSGAQFALRTRPGSNFVTRGSSLNVDAPQLQWTDRAAAALGQRYTNLSLGGLLSGPIRPDRAFYNVSYQLGRRSSDLQSLLDTDPRGLAAAGVAADSVGRLLGILAAQRVPSRAGGIPGDRLSDNGSLFGSVDFTPPGAAGGHAFNVTFNGGWNAQRPAFGAVTELPSAGGERTSWRGGVQARHSGYFTLRGVGVLGETTVGASGSRNDATPFLQVPAGRVRVSSSLSDGAQAVSTLAFGGGQFTNGRQGTATADFLSQLSWFSANNAHRIRLTAEGRHDAFSVNQRNNLLGTFTYNSLADLEGNRPASYSRQLQARRRSASQLTGGLSLGDAWRKSRDLQLQYGVRVDGGRFLDEPAYNAEVERSFGVRNDRAPASLYVSPRVGFSWTYGTAPQVNALVGAARAPRAVLRGGAGVFQGTPGTQSVTQALDNTGLPGALQQLVCVGSAAPVPDWEGYAADPGGVPTRCADGSDGAFANSSPNVTLFARDWRAPRSVRGNLQWSGPALGNRFSTSADVTWSLNLNQAGGVDLNFAPPAEGFSLADEGGRPVFARPASIVPATGAIAARDALRVPGFARVTELRSDLVSRSAQLTLRVAPASFSSRLSWNVSYVLSRLTDEQRGFQSAGGDPRVVERGRSAFDSRHQFTYSVGYNFWDAVRVNWFGQLRSGQPYTPGVVGDLNGDGYQNDRAFVFDPTTVAGADPELAAAMRALLERGSPGARECLGRQLGAVAGRNSCQGPWSSNATLSVGFNPQKLRLPQRASLSLQLSNPLGAADLLLNGERGLRGWGQPVVPDQSLLYVRGFDPVARRYRYDVNQRFGATDPARSTFRSPVVVTVLMRVDVGPTRERQMLTQQLDRGRRSPGTRTPEPLLRAMYAGGGLLNPVAAILRQQDTLRLTGAQADSLASLNRRYSMQVDSIWAPVARHFGALPDAYDRSDAYDRYIAARKASVDLLVRIAPHVRGLLTAEQRRMLPVQVTSHLDARYLASVRNGTASFAGGMGASTPSAGGAMTPAMGGGGQQIIIRQ